jgi:hypothetical protein
VIDRVKELVLATRKLTLILAVVGLSAALGVGMVLVVKRLNDEDISPPRSSHADTPADAAAGWVAKFHPAQRSPAKRLVLNPPHLEIRKAEGKVNDDESVLGVELGGESRAYPLDMLTQIDNGIVNDTLGGRPIVASWCNSCQAGAVYSRQLDNETLSFAITGESWLENMIMGDLETQCRWSQVLGRAMDGRLMGKELDAIPSVVTDWKTWRTQHPDTTVAELSRVPERISQVARFDSQTSDGGFVLGYSSGSEARAWPFAALRSRPVINDQLGARPLLITFDDAHRTASLFSRSLNGHVLTFQLKAEGPALIDDRTQSLWDPFSGQATDGPLKGKVLERLPGMVVIEMYWVTFHPKSTTWTAPK